tara:strand:+ start:10810 stop:11373 length:564 start_codon:yes stop_codon:yes gene_type:complete
MMHNQINKSINCAGWSRMGFLGVLIAAVIGWHLFEYLSSLIPATKINPSIPFVLITLLFSPFLYCTQYYFKLSDLRSVSGVSDSERRRLHTIIDEKITQLRFALTFYVLAAATTAILIFLVSNNPDYFKSSMKFIGALFSVSIFSLALIHHETNELSIFKANLKNRAAKKKNKASHLKQLQRSKPDS